MGISVAVRAVVLLSGGMDSSIAAHAARAAGRRLHVLAVDYGQRHARELACARWQARRLGAAEFLRLRLPLGRLAKGALVDGSLIRRSGLRQGRPPTYVSFRNGVLLACAASLAEARGAQEVWGGWCKDDLGGYPDCGLPFFRAFEKAVHAGTWAGRRGRRLRIRAPLAKLDKGALTRLGARLGVDFAHTWTCYQPRAARPCGRCDACRLRARGFRGAGLKDPMQ